MLDVIKKNSNIHFQLHIGHITNEYKYISEVFNLWISEPVFYFLTEKNFSVNNVNVLFTLVQKRAFKENKFNGSNLTPLWSNIVSLPYSFLRFYFSLMSCPCDILSSSDSALTTFYRRQILPSRYFVRARFYTA